MLVLHEPTAGIDIGSKAEIHAIIEQLARSGIGIVLMTYDITEILNMCDTICILYKGSIVKVVLRRDKEFNKKDIMLIMEGKGNNERANQVRQ